MTQTRPPAVLVMAILNTVFAALWLLGGICNGINVMMLPLLSSVMKGLPNNPVPKMTQIPGYLPFEIGAAVFGIVFAILMLVSGIGMFSAKPWARQLAIFVGALLLLEQIGSVAFQLLYLNPLLVRANQEQFQQMPGMSAINTPALMAVGVALKAAIPTVYAIALLIMMFLPVVRAGFRPRVHPDRQDAGYDDNTIVEDQDYYDREERRP